MLGRHVSQYEIVAKLGEGGMGVVWKARDTELGRFVALKTIPAGAVDADRRSRLLDEARTASALNQANIVTVHGLVHDDTSSYVVMEWIDGRTLDELIASGGLPLGEALRIAGQIASALEAAHAAGIVHRDLKPRNVMVTTGGVVKVLDFGLAKLAHPEFTGADEATRTARAETEEGTIRGTVAYMSPEQAEGRRVDVRSDIFSFGSVFYEMLTGRRAFQAASRVATMAAILHVEPAPLRETAPSLPAGVDALLTRCLRKDPARRWQHGSDLRAALDDLRVSTDPGTRAQERPSAPRRNVWRVAALGLAATAALGTAGYFYYSRRPPPLAARDQILLADFTNTTGDDVFDGALKQALAASLSQSTYLNVMSDQQVGDVLRLAGRSTEERVTGQLARDICARANLKAFLVGSIAPIGNRYTLGLQALNCRTGATIGIEQAEAASKDEVIRVLGEAVTRMRQTLGESLASIETFNTPLEGVTTTSIEALRAYSLGEAAAHKGQPTEACTFHKKAVELDPNFARAYLAQAITCAGPLRVPSITKAFELRHRASERERLRIESDYYDSVTGETDKASEAYRIVAELYPAPDVLRNWGLVEARLGRLEHALELLKEAVQAGGLNDGILGRTYLQLNRFAEARTALEANPNKTLPAVHLLLYRLAWIENDRAAMDGEIAWFSKQPDYALFTIAQAEFAASNGRFRESRDLLNRGRILPTMRAVLESHVGNSREAVQSADEALETNRALNTLFAAAMTFAQSGAPEKARVILDEAVERFPLNLNLKRSFGPQIRAAIELTRRNGKGAVALLEPEPPFGSKDYLYLRGTALLAAGDGKEAVGVFERLIADRAIMVTVPSERFPSPALLQSLSHLGLGRAHAVTGNNLAARKAYEDFLALWKDADPDVPILKQAKQEYARLPR